MSTGKTSPHSKVLLREEKSTGSDIRMNIDVVSYRTMDIYFVVPIDGEVGGVRSLVLLPAFPFDRQGTSNQYAI